MEEKLAELGGKIVTIILPTTNRGFSFTLKGYLFPRYGHPSGYKMVFESQSDLWFHSEAVYSVNVLDKLIVLKVK